MGTSIVLTNFLCALGQFFFLCAPCWSQIGNRSLEANPTGLLEVLNKYHVAYWGLFITLAVLPKEWKQWTIQIIFNKKRKDLGIRKGDVKKREKIKSFLKGLGYLDMYKAFYEMLSAGCRSWFQRTGLLQSSRLVQWESWQGVHSNWGDLKVLDPPLASQILRMYVHTESLGTIISFDEMVPWLKINK